MRKIVFSDSTITWFTSYFERTQTVSFNNTISEELSIKTGIGQGPILGPLLFIFYINDIVVTEGCLKINMYADDCISFSSGNNWTRMQRKIGPEFSNILSWCTLNCLKLSESKSKTLLIGSNTKLNNVNYNCSLCLANTELEFVEQYEYLGITLDKHMSLNPLLTDVKKKVVGQLLKLRK